MRRLLCLLLLCAAPAWGAVLTTEFGSFSALTSATTHADRVCVCDGRRAVVFLFDLTGTSFTGNLQQSIDSGSSWTDVSGSATSTDLALVAINNPVGCYRPELTAASSASVVVTWRCAAD